MTSKEYNEFCDKLIEIERAQNRRREEPQQLREIAQKKIDEMLRRHRERA